ncbi:hypothetical protein L6R49_00125 [Myxococcota bacterium]|nr:hypothetical protein [Myxococcota bacterium]
MQTRLADHLANALFLPARLVRRALPRSVREHLEDRLFYAIFQVTRVTNDAYPRREAAAEPGAPAEAAPTSAPAASPPLSRPSSR